MICCMTFYYLIINIVWHVQFVDDELREKFAGPEVAVF